MERRREFVQFCAISEGILPNRCHTDRFVMVGFCASSTPERHLSGQAPARRTMSAIPPPSRVTTRRGSARDLVRFQRDPGSAATLSLQVGERSRCSSREQSELIYLPACG